MDKSERSEQMGWLTEKVIGWRRCRYCRQVPLVRQKVQLPMYVGCEYASSPLVLSPV